MQSRSIAQAIPEYEFENLCVYLLNELPDKLMSASGELKKQDLKFAKRGNQSGIFAAKLNPVFTQTLIANNADKKVVLETCVKSSQWQKVLEALPNDSESAKALRCLVLIDDEEREKEKKCADEMNDLYAPELQRKKELITPNNEKWFVQVLLEKNQGIVMHHMPAHAEAWAYLRDRLMALNQCGVRTLYVCLPKLLFDPVFKFFNKTGDKEFLAKYLNYYSGALKEVYFCLIHLCTKAKEQGIEVVPVDSLDLNQKGDRSNFVAFSIIEQQKHRQGKFLLLADIALYEVANTLKIPAIALKPDAKAHLIPYHADVSKIVVKFNKELVKISDYCLDVRGRSLGLMDYVMKFNDTVDSVGKVIRPIFFLILLGLIIKSLLEKMSFLSDKLPRPK